MPKTKKKADAVLRISRAVPPQSIVAAEIDRVSEQTGESVQSVMLKSVQCGLPEAEKILQQFQKSTK